MTKGDAGGKIGGVHMVHGQVRSVAAKQFIEGDRVMVAKAYGSAHQFVGRLGKIERLRGLGKFDVRLDSGEIICLDRKCLRWANG